MTFLAKKSSQNNSKFNKIPVESPNGVLLKFTLPNGDAFISESLVVKLDGVDKTPDLDYSEDSGNKSFTFILNDDDGNRMDIAPEECEDLRLDYVVSRENC